MAPACDSGSDFHSGIVGCDSGSDFHSGIVGVGGIVQWRIVSKDERIVVTRAEPLNRLKCGGAMRGGGGWRLRGVGGGGRERVKRFMPPRGPLFQKRGRATAFIAQRLGNKPEGFKGHNLMLFPVACT